VVVLFVALVQVIEGYRETEKSEWTEESRPLLERLQEWTRRGKEGEGLELLEKVHVLDLSEEGEIKPHIDSVKVQHRLEQLVMDRSRKWFPLESAK